MTRSVLLCKFDLFASLLNDGDQMQFENRKTHFQHTDHAHYWAYTKSC